MNVGYDGLSPAQKRIVRQAYPALDDGDEPPYPLHGPQGLLRRLNIMGGEYWLNGEVTLWVLVAADGSVVSAFATGIDEPEAARKAAIAAGLLKYRPARCGGQPCQMMLPFSVVLTTTALAGQMKWGSLRRTAHGRESTMRGRWRDARVCSGVDGQPIPACAWKEIRERRASGVCERRPWLSALCA